MILYFSGTGNSRYAAEVIAEITGDSLISMNDRIKNNNTDNVKSNNPFVFVSPIYAGRIPKIVEKYIKETKFSGSKKVYFVATCFQDAYNSLHYIEKLCKEKGFEFMGFKAVGMPQNYIAMYPILNKSEAEKVVERATPEIKKIGETIRTGEVLPTGKVAFNANIMSGIVNPIFYPCFVSAKGFHTTEGCTSCGKCMKLCPLNNVKLVDGKPQWGKECTHCMACIDACPSKAIEYKNSSKGKPRYYNNGYPK